MCLDTLTENTYPIRGFGYKFFDKEYRGNDGDHIGLCGLNTAVTKDYTIFERGTWYESEQKILLTNFDNEPYESGYHMYTTSHGSYHAYLVEYEGILAVGIQDEETVIVAKRMKICV